ncbi:MAG: mechanosensitive ion channel family protein [Planctomyces sp.]|jgi:small conductance mechanosensitive channel|nr:mechanosensitive ion channel [Planctomyces sp.]
MTLQTFGRIFNLLPQLAVQDTPAAAPTESADLLQQVRDVLTADLSREMLLRVLTHWLPAIAAAAAVFLFGRILVRLAVSMIEQASRRARMDETLAKFVGNFASIILQLVVCIASLSCLGIDTTSLSAVLVASGFAVGMALQGSLGNVASGVLLVFFRPFRVGDTIEVGAHIGRVVEIQIFNTLLLSPDNVRIILPNASITGGTIRNLSAEPNRRIDLVIGCSYNDPLRDVRRMLEQIVAAEPRILADPAPVIAVSELAESSVNFVVRPWVRSADYHAVKFSLTEQIKLGFDDRGLTIPFPSRDVFIHHSGTESAKTVFEAAASAA